uniref:8c6e66d3-8bf1-4001-9e05-c326f76ef3b5-CDS n=1 Tax=Plasmodiophora brassicae TaxID=37360 RepID=A0A3P3YW88_PLABS|nr:8c6e66d3-8bf1-4001-9e05-c326f76ef3b5-CDS [Plasmodiophora brassicae]
MPQLDKVTVFSQVFWTILFYYFFFLILWKYYLLDFSKLFKLREIYNSIGCGVLNERSVFVNNFIYNFLVHFKNLNITGNSLLFNKELNWKHYKQKQWDFIEQKYSKNYSVVLLRQACVSEIFFT